MHSALIHYLTYDPDRYWYTILLWLTFFCRQGQSESRLRGGHYLLVLLLLGQVRVQHLLLSALAVALDARGGQILLDVGRTTRKKPENNNKGCSS